MSKKQSKKVVATVVSTPTFNKKNAQAFADFIFSDKHGMITCTKLCRGELQDGKDGKRTMHCAVGEAYFTFVNPSLKQVLAKDNLAEEYESKYGVSSGGSTAAAIDALVEVANLKNKSDKGKVMFAEALNECVSSNDDDELNNDEVLVYMERAREVAETWTNSVVPLLK